MKQSEDARVTICQNYDAGSQLMKKYEKINGFISRSSREIISETITDEQGVFEIQVNREGSYFIHVKKIGYSKAELGPIVVESNKSADDIVIVLEKGGSIGGKIVGYKDTTSKEIVVGASRGDGFPLYTKVDKEGLYRFDLLTPGKWFVRVIENLNYYHNNYIHRELAESPEIDIPWNCEVINGEMTEFDIEMVGVDDIILIGKVLLGDQVPKGWKIWISKEDESGRVNIVDRIGANGEIKLCFNSTGEYKLRVLGPTGSGPFLYVQDIINLTYGENIWTFKVKTGQIEIEDNSNWKDRNLEMKYCWSENSDLSVYANFEFDNTGNVFLPIVPCGAGIITGRVVEKETNQKYEVFRKEIYVEEGAILKVNLGEK